MLVKIIRNTVRVNPTAGNTVTRVQGNRDITFKTKGALPGYLVENQNCVITEEWSDGTIIGKVFVSEVAEKLMEDRNFSVSIEQDFQVMHHRPEPKYLYKYENPLVECSNCCTFVPVDNIEYEYNEDYEKYQVCPECGDFNTFEQIEYESFDENFFNK